MLSLGLLDDAPRIQKRQVLNFSVIVSSAIMILKGLMVVTVFNSISSPQITCLPAFHHGDDLFLTNNTESPIRAGETVVFRIEGRETPIVKGGRQTTQGKHYTERPYLSEVWYHSEYFTFSMKHFHSSDKLQNEWKISRY
uniref:Signal peptidase complex catalytic subunit SEC11 n=1 Tax=Paramormyrops kingsleyae TaxID=1676925 RepID=A0A3B3S5T6_9TELE